MLPIIQQVANEYKAELQKLYGDELAELILFGSYARGDYWEESDVDFAVVLDKEEISPFEEITKTSGASSKLSLKYGILVSSFHTTLYKKQTSIQGVYQEIRKEGILI